MPDDKKVVAKKKNIKDHGIKISFIDPLEIHQSGMSSVELKRNAKGLTEIIVKVYASNAEDAKEDAIKNYEDLSRQFPSD